MTESLAELVSRLDDVQLDRAIDEAQARRWNAVEARLAAVRGRRLTGRPCPRCGLVAAAVAWRCSRCGKGLWVAPGTPVR
jgi:hypothetical protein